MNFIKDFLASMTGEVAKNWLRIDGYFKMFEILISSSLEFPDMYHFFINSQMISCLIDFVMEKASPINISNKKYSLGTKSNPMNFKHCINIIFFLLKNSYGLCGTNYEIPLV
eukprot:GHVR01159699.1.p2 GENE.GHVR01159699.1~~GHVR01159699.1.p2  ORF type:complete len:112 (-),score=1.16 GHVR01159699.1:3280-3615(-)